MTKMFYHGRTEAIRSVTPESADFVKTFWADNPPPKKVEALKTATQKHTAITRECSKAQGQDRHLYALYCVWQRAVNAEHEYESNGTTSPTEAGETDSTKDLQRTTSPNGQASPSRTQLQHMPALFTDPGWEKINTTVLSTSNCGNPALRHFGFGPVSADGFGIGYIIKDDSISICVSSKHRQTKRFVDSIESYFNEIRKLLKATKPKSPAPNRISRAREAEEKATKENRLKSHGRMIKGDSRRQSYVKGIETPMSEATTGEDDDDGLGGCKCLPILGSIARGLTDYRWVLRCWHAVTSIKEEGATPAPAEQVAQKRRAVGKKLALTEY